MFPCTLLKNPVTTMPIKKIRIDQRSRDELIDMAQKMSGEREIMYDLLTTIIVNVARRFGVMEGTQLFNAVEVWCKEGAEACGCGKKDCGYNVIIERIRENLEAEARNVLNTFTQGQA